MKWITTFLAIATIAIACEKSPMIESKEEAGVVAGTSKETSGLVGTWSLISYYEDNGTGNGVWKSPDFEERISFGAEGSFSSSPTFPMYSRGYSKYVTKDLGWVTLFSSQSETGDRYQYVLESPTQLLFYPQCREQCMRRYQLK